MKLESNGLTIMILTFTVTVILVQPYDERYTREGMMIPYKGSCLIRRIRLGGQIKLTKNVGRELIYEPSLPWQAKQ